MQSKPPSGLTKKKTIPAAPPPEAPTGTFGVHQKTVITRHQTASTIFDPAVLEHYARLVPDAPERVLRVFEQNSEVERQIARQGFEAARADNRRRDWMGFAIIMTGLLVSALFGYIGRFWLSGGTLIAIIAYGVIGYLYKPKAPPPGR